MMGTSPLSRFKILIKKIQELAFGMTIIYRDVKSTRKLYIIDELSNIYSLTKNYPSGENAFAQEFNDEVVILHRFRT